MPIPQSRPPRLRVSWLIVLCLLLTTQLSFGYRRKSSLSASDWNVNFGGLQVGTTATMPEVLTNAGQYPVTLTSASLAGAGFAVSGPSFPLTLGPGESVTLEVGRHGRTFEIPVIGTGTGTRSISAVPASLSFGSVAVGSSLVKAATLTATGAAAVISSVTTTNPEFTVSGLTLPLTLNVGQSVPFTVKFSPQSTGTASASLSFTTDGSGLVASQTLSGAGSAAAVHSVSLSWHDSTAEAAGYNIHRGIASGGPYTKVNPSVDAANDYTDATVASGASYFYVVTAVDGAGSESQYSAEVGLPFPFNSRQNTKGCA